MVTTFRPFSAQAPLANLTRRVEMQKAALDQAIADLNEARLARGLVEDEPLIDRRLPSAVPDPGGGSASYRLG